MKMARSLTIAILSVIALACGGGGGDGSSPPSSPPEPAGWTKFASNPVLGPGAPGDWDDLLVTNPSVVQVGPASYLMWYEGLGSTLFTPQIGLATASDGVIWTKLAGGPVLTAGPPGSWDEFGVEEPRVDFDGTTYRMWYVSDGWIGLATSSDGVTWTKSASNPVLIWGDPGAWDSGGVFAPHVIRAGSGFRMWYSGLEPATGRTRIGYATSADGVAWTKSATPVLDVGVPGSWESDGIDWPSVLLDGATYRMWYNGMDASGALRIGHAESVDGIAWTKYSANPVLVSGAAPAWDSARVYAAWVTRDGSVFKMWYAGTAVGADGHRIGYATSP